MNKSLKFLAICFIKTGEWLMNIAEKKQSFEKRTLLLKQAQLSKKVKTNV